MNKRICLGILSVSFLLTTVTASACTTVLVGKGQTTDGSYIAARTVDSILTNVTRLTLHPHVEKQKGMYTSSQDQFTYPLPETALAYSAIPDTADDNAWGEAGFNEAGVGMSSTESIASNEKVLAIDPYVKDTGVTEATIFNTVLPSIHNAHDGAALLGKIIEEKGSGAGFGVAFADKTGIWYLESAGGHRWMAAKIPDNAYFVTANQGRLRTYDPTDTKNYMGPKDLIEFAQQHNLYQPKNEDFNFSKAYMRNIALDHTYNYPRVWVMQHTLTPSITTTIDDGSDFPVFLSATKKISINDVKAILRNHYTGTDHDPYLNNNPQEPYRPIDIFRCEESHIIQIRPDLPTAIGNVIYIAFGMPGLSLYIPYYQGLDSYLPAYTKAQQEASDDSAFWKYRRVQTLAMYNYNTYAPIVQKAYTDFEAATAVKQADMEKKYLNLYREHPVQAKKLLQDFENEVMQEGLDLADSLFNKIITMMTHDIGNKYLFKGA
jgi:dipeptidase